MPVLRVPDECAYYKEDAGKILLGAFETQVETPGEWTAFRRISSSTSCPRISTISNRSSRPPANRMPMLAEAGIHTFFNGPESFTPDDAYHLGLCPRDGQCLGRCRFQLDRDSERRAAAGMALAQWMEDGEKPFDLGDVDVTRMQPFQGNRRYLVDRATEVLGLL